MRYDDTPLEDLLGYVEDVERRAILEAKRYVERERSGDVRASGDPASRHCVQVASILVRMKLDPACVIAGLLHDVPEAARKIAETDIRADSPRSERQARERARAAAAQKVTRIEEAFGAEVAALVGSLSRLSELKSRDTSATGAETARKMLFAVSRDLRVVLIALADKLDSARSVSFLEEDARKRIAAECLSVYAPVADRLGIAWLKDELEDLALKALNRGAYDQIKALVSGRKDEREAFLTRAEGAMRDSMAKAGLDVEVKSRAKHFYSIYQKMRKRAKSSAEMYDLFGMRIVCASEQDCYAALGVVHATWKPLDGRFKDYVAMPKKNGYRSLHTTVESLDGVPLEVQIRTHEMHKIAEFGVASHWLYKGGAGKAATSAALLPTVNLLRDWDGDRAGDSDFMDILRREVLGTSIVVFTPEGDAIELRSGSTPIDFAFAIHSGVGLSCAGAKVDGHIAPLDQTLKPAQTVEILTSSTAHPNVNWLRIARTRKARSRIRAWLIENDQALAIDRNIVAKRKAAKEEPEEESRKAVDEGIPDTIEIRPSQEDEIDGSRDIAVQGSRGMMIRVAGCCRPVAGDRIVGFVSRGRGIAVHRADCPVVASIPDFEERSVECAWVNPKAPATRRLRVVAKADGAIFSEVENAIRKSGARLLEGRVERDGSFMKGRFAIGAPDRESLKRAVKDLRSLPVICKLEYE